MSSSIVDLGMVPIDDVYSKNRETGPVPSSKAKNCAECRRLKQKCDRKVPCQNCIRRGCSSLCPDGQLVSKGNRLILSNTEDLHSRIEDLSSRIRELESALATSHGKHSDEPHPLLTRDQLLTGTIRKEEEDPNEALVTSFGSLMVGGDGTAKFFGATSGAEWVIPLEDDDPDNGYKCTPVSVVNGISLSLDSIKNQSNLAAPPNNPGISSRNTAAPSLSYGLSPYENAADLDLISNAFPHSIDRTLLNIPALKRLVMTELPPREKAISLINLYYGRVAWEFDPVPRKRLIEEIFLPLYDNLQDPPVSSHAMGLLYASLHVGRPPMISRQHFDVELPLDTPDVSEAEPNFHRGKHYFSQVCLWPVLDLTVGCKGSYSAVLKLDKKLRDWVLPKKMQVPRHVHPEDQQTAYTFQVTVIFIVREITLLCLHRSYFACALLEPPFDPLRSKYSRSVLAAYASACAILGRIRTLYAREPIIIARFTLFWTHSFSAAVMLGAIATRAPDCPLAATAIIEFDHAVEMFSRAQHGYRPGRLLPTLLQLQTKAHAAMKEYRAGTWTRPTGPDSQLFPGLSGSKAEVYYTRQNQQQQQQSGQAQSSPSPSTSSNDGSNIMTSLESVQPTLDEYLRSFGSAQPGSGPEAGVTTAAEAVQITGSENGAVGTATNSHHPMDIPSSDAFLRGALTGNWASLNTAPVTEMSFMDMFGQYPPVSQPYDFGQPSSSQSQLQGTFIQSMATTPMNQMMSSAHPQQHQYQTSISSSSYAHSPFSDTSVSGSSSTGRTSGQGGYGLSTNQGANLQPPMQAYVQQQQQQQVPQAMREVEPTFFWDNFLSNLGVPGAPQQNA
ncbi:hypothetical protein FRC20_001246 [Serendipita sp. 405]|nr:hypothetical protein FRC20_001246 [Serendipita sp. 405]